MTSSFAQRCGIHDAERERRVLQAVQRIDASGIELLRVSWCDLHGFLRGKSLVASAAGRALREGVGMVSTLMLKDSSDRTAFGVFEPGGTASLPGFGQANNLVLMPDPDSLRELPWAAGTAWLRAQPWFQHGCPVELDTRSVLQRALARLKAAGFTMMCGLEVEFHIYSIRDAGAQLDPGQAAWPGEPPSSLSMIHPGYSLLNEVWIDMADEPLRIVQRTAQALGLPLLSLELEFGPSQVEAVFDATDALTAADNMVLFRNATKMALQRAGYHSSFVCRPPFPNVMSSGWHLHQSLLESGSGRPAFMRDAPAAGSTPMDAAHALSDTGQHYLAGLLAHAGGMAAFCTPTINGYGRFKPHALAPQSAVWGRDNRGAMLRVVGDCGDDATRIENRIGEPAANPYLYMASQVHAGLDGLERQLRPPSATQAPYAPDATAEPGATGIPATLEAALRCLDADRALRAGFGDAFVDYFLRIKQSEVARHAAAADPEEFQRREYFSRL